MTSAESWIDHFGQDSHTGTMPKPYSLYESQTKRATPEPKTAEERLDEFERTGLLHTVPVTPGQAKFPFGVARTGGLKRFLDDRE